MRAMKIFTRERFLSTSECRTIIERFDRIVELPGSSQRDAGLWRHERRTEVAARLFLDGDGTGAGQLLGHLRDVVGAEVRTCFDDPCLLLEFTLVTQMRPGDLHPLHADNERRLGSG